MSGKHVAETARASQAPVATPAPAAKPAPTVEHKREEKKTFTAADAPLVTLNKILILASPPGGVIDPSGALAPSLAVSATPGLVLTTNPAAVATGGVDWENPDSLNATPVYVKPANPATTTSSTPVMMGLGSSVFITPKSSGNILVDFDFTGSNLTPNRWLSAIVYGTGTAPANGVAVPGGATVLTPQRGTQSASTFGDPVSFEGIALGLTVGTQYWFDLELASPTGAGTASVTQVSASLAEL